MKRSEFIVKSFFGILGAGSLIDGLLPDSTEYTFDELFVRRTTNTRLVYPILSSKPMENILKPLKTVEDKFSFYYGVHSVKIPVKRTYKISDFRIVQEYFASKDPVLSFYGGGKYRTPFYFFDEGGVLRLELHVSYSAYESNRS